MAITTAQQTQILQMIQAMFGAAPGATYLSQFENSVAADSSIVNLAQTLSGAVAFYGKSYSAGLSSVQFADAFISDLVGSRASTADKAWATGYIVEKMAASATQASIISELTQALSSVSPENANWGAAATAYNTSVATKVIDNLVDNTATGAAKTDAVNYIVGQMAAGQSLGSMIEWTITALDSIDHADSTWGNAAALFDNRIEVSKYYSVDKAGAATDLGTLQQALKAVTASADSVTSAKAIFDTALSGKAVDGYLSGATVFADIDGDGKQGTNEPSATTDAKGNFTLPAGTFGKLITTGGTDISTNLPFKGSLTAPAGSTVINPLTTLQQGFVEKGQSAEQAQKTVAKALGLDDSKFDLTTFDPLAVALDANASAEARALAAQLQAEAAKIANFIVAAGQTLIGAAGGADKLDASAAMDSLVKAIVNAIATDSAGVVSFSDKAMLETIMNESVALSGNANLIAAADKVAGLADNFAAMSAASADNVDKAITAGGDITAIMVNIAQAQAVAQGDMANKLLVAAAGGDLTSIQSSFTGTAFDAAANKAVIGDLDPNSTTDDTATASSNTAAGATTASNAVATGGSTPTPTFTVTQVAGTTIIIGTADADNINFPAGLNGSIVTGLAGNDTINTGVGNDIVRPGEGADTVNTGTGNDIVVVVGQTAAGQYAQSDITNPGGSGIDLSSVITLADLNGRAISEVVSGESIDGGAGTNRLVIYGNVDLTGVTLTNMSQFQVNSTVTISAQQLAALDLSVIFGDGESVLNITNSSADPVTLDLSGMNFTDFHTFNVGSGVTVVLDQADVDSLQYLSGEGTVKASTATGTLNLVSKYVTLDVQDKDGNADATHGGGIYVAGKLLIGTESAETLTGDTSDDRIEGGASNDILVGSDGNDVLRGGAGVDSMDGGAGNDTFVIVGDISGGGKVDSAADTAALGFPLTNLNGQNLNEDEDGATEIIIGGEGDDTLYVYGTADLTNFDITGIEHIEIRSNVTFNAKFLNDLVTNGNVTLTGDGSSTIRIEGGSASDPLVVDLTLVSSLQLFKIGQISLGPNVVLKVASTDDLGGAHTLTGEGTIQSTSSPLDLSGYTKTATLSVKNLGGSDATGAEVLDKVIASSGTTVNGTTGDDYLMGSAADETFYTSGGNDVLSGKAGNDTFVINGSGKKIILDSSGVDTLDLSSVTSSGANVDLTDGGTAGSATIELGSGSAATGKLPLDMFLVEDLSGSFGDDVATVRGLLDNLITQVRAVQSDSQFGAGSFVDKPALPFGDVNYGDYVYRTDAKINSDTATVKTAFDNMVVLSGYDGPEAQLEALYQIALRTIKDDASSGTTSDEIGFRPGSVRFVVLATDAPYHLAGDYASAGVNNGDTILDGTPPGSGEDYPTVIQVKDALLKANIYPIFAVTSGNETTYQDLASQLGRGDVVGLSSDSSNLVNSIKTGLSNYKVDFIENLVGTEQADILTGNSLDNRIAGGGGDDILSGGSGKDYLSGGTGKDFVVYTGAYGDYKISTLGSGLSIASNADSSDVDYIAGDIEFIKFSDITKSAIFSGGVIIDEGSGGALRSHLHFAKDNISYIGDGSAKAYGFNKVFNFSLDGLGDTVAIDSKEYKWALADFDLNRDNNTLYNVIDTIPKVDPATYLKADAWLKFGGLNLDFDKSSIAIPVSGSFTPGNYDFNYNVTAELNPHKSGSTLFIDTKVLSSAQSSDFGNLLGDFSFKLGVTPKLDVSGSLSTGIKIQADAPGISAIDETLGFEINDFSALNETYNLLDFDLGKLAGVADKYIPDTIASFAGKDHFYGRFDSKGSPFDVQVNSPDIGSLGEGKISLSYPDSFADSKLVDVNATFNSWKVGSDLVQAKFDIDDIIGLAFKPMSFTDLHVNMANITSSDYKDSSPAGKTVFDGLAKIDAFGDAFAKEYYYDTGLTAIDDAVKGVNKGIEAFNAASGTNGVKLSKFHIPFTNGTTDLSLEFDTTLFGLDINAGVSPVIKYNLDALDVLFDMYLSSKDDPTFNKTISGKLGEQVSITLPDGVDDVGIDMTYTLKAHADTNLDIAVNAGLDMKALGLSGTVMGNKIADLPNDLISIGDVKSDANYLMHLPPSGSPDEHLKYDLFQDTYAAATFGGVDLSIIGSSEHYDFRVV